MDKARVKEVLLKNKDKNFVQRVMNPRIFPQVNNLSHSGSGLAGSGHSTHLMRAEVDEFGEWFAFPSIFQDKDGRLLRIDNPSEALEYAKKTGEIISFGKDADSAIEFSRDYKKVWE